MRATSSSLMVTTGPGAAVPVARDEARGVARVVDPNSLDTIARRVAGVSGSGSSTTSVGFDGVAGGAGATRFMPHAAVRTTAASPSRRRDLPLDMRGTRVRASLGCDADGQRGSADADDRRRRLQTNGVGRELGDASGDVDGGAPDELQDHPQAPFARRIDVPLDPHFAVRPERDPGVVF